MTNRYRTARLLIICITLISIFAIAAFRPDDAKMPDLPTIGGTPAESLECAEDEVIAFSAPNTLDCIHIDTFTDDMGVKGLMLPN